SHARACSALRDPLEGRRRRRRAGQAKCIAGNSGAAPRMRARGIGLKTNWAAWSPDGDLVQEVEEQFARTIESYRIHPDLVSEHANHEESIRTGGYANRTLLELVQNAADALAGSSDADGDSAG